MARHYRYHKDYIKEKKLESIHNQYGFLFQNVNKYFCQINCKGGGIKTIYNSGFKNLEQFESWIAGQFSKRGLDYRVGYTWKYKDSEDIFNLIDKSNKIVKQK